MQLDLFPPPAPPIPVAAPVERAPDPLAEKLVATGLVPGDWYLHLNSCLRDNEWSGAPSRMFLFPVEYVKADRRGDGQSALLLYHPALADMPYAMRVYELTGIKPHWEPLDEYGRDRGLNRRWHHAVDLCTKAHWRDLLASRHLTDDALILDAVDFALRCKSIDSKIADAIRIDLKAVSA